MRWDEFKAGALKTCPENWASPNPLIAAVRLRAISVVELEDKFVISFLEASVDGPNRVMAGWIEGLRKS